MLKKILLLGGLYVSTIASAYCIVGSIVSTLSSRSVVLIREKPLDGDFEAPDYDDRFRDDEDIAEWYEPPDFHQAIFGRIGDTVFGERIEAIENRRVCIGKTWYFTGECKDEKIEKIIDWGYEPQNEFDVAITSQLKEYYSTGIGLLQTMMSASSEFIVNDKGDVIGVQLNDIDVESIFQKMGIENGDIILSINKQKLTSPAVAIGILKLCKDEPSWDLEILRGEHVINKHIFTTD